MLRLLQVFTNRYFSCRRREAEPVVLEGARLGEVAGQQHDLDRVVAEHDVDRTLQALVPGGAGCGIGRNLEPHIPG